ncbi:hypothetical protein QQZ08_001202 [Neonectria magnoliae]|uniref:Apple domain-containing protein n=1 Tax=Neonectria magnoliae TaxID=2732573 RepID=A0ABR1IHJ6_9HYPO
MFSLTPLAALAVGLLGWEVSAGPCKPSLDSTASTESSSLTSELGNSFTVSSSTDLTTDLSPTSLESTTTILISDITSTATSSTLTSKQTTASEDTTSSTTTQEESTTSTTTADAEPTETGFLINGGFEKMSVGGGYTGEPWTLGRGVTLVDNPAYAHSGRYSIVVTLPTPSTGTGGLWALTQPISGLDKTKTYILTYWWAFSDVQDMGGGGVKFTTYTSGGIAEDISRSATPANVYQKRVITFGTNPADGQLRMRLSPSGPLFKHAEIRFDDISIVEYDPPCTLVSPPVNGQLCGTYGSADGQTGPYQIGQSDNIPFEDCALKCKVQDRCKLFSFFGPAYAGSCNLYSGTKEQIGFVEKPKSIFTRPFYERECWVCT